MSDLIRQILTEKSDNTLLQLFRYTFVGGFAFLIDFALLYVLTEYVHCYYIVSATISFLAGLLANYLLSKVWVFTQSQCKNAKIEFLLFAVIGLVGLLLNDLLIWLLSNFIGLWYMLSKIIATVITYLWNFFARKYLLFSRK
ncbi:MAG: GtrA family protein [Bacteroidaceae bacterium]|nr:GtrA family protein [Bacteroidaceae bacterium]